jgi:starch phosphorylase
MRTVRTFVVVPALPERLSTLLEIANNLWWTWNSAAVELFHRIDPDLWEAVDHNPLSLLGQLSHGTLESLARDDSFVSHMDTVARKLSEYLSGPTWYKKTYGADDGQKIAYFSAEYGFHECLPIYSGGLGVLSGDHLKSASDLGLPLVGVGLAYRQGYFRQYLNSDGWQQERYPENEFHTLPLQRVRDVDGKILTVKVPVGDREVLVRVWRVQVGRVPLYLLDSNVSGNSDADRGITAQLYGGDAEMRIQQEILLGIGGIRVLRSLGIDPTVCHMNEGHSAFLALARIRCLMRRHHMTFSDAREANTAGHVFTTHTPVPAGNDRFSPSLVLKYLGPYCSAMGLQQEELLALGREDPSDDEEPFCMTVLALKLSAHANGVSKLHRVVSQSMWKELWPQVPPNESPIDSITNGVHIPSWLSDEIERLYRRYLGPQWRNHMSEPAMWERVRQIPSSELWRGHARMRERLVAFARERLRIQLQRRGLPPAEVARANEVLDPEALTIGFARRFATYKRATLLFRDLDRLAAILGDRDRSVQIIFAGKAHPHDTAGKELIREIIHIAHQDPFRNRLVFIEDYDINIARHLVQGVDVWLNTPRRPFEASGTSGMKGPPNGGLNLSILDGWWCEAYRVDNGWAIGSGEEYEDAVYGDEVEANSLLALIEQELVPLFYDRGTDGLPRGWIARMKSSMATVCPTFNTDRMVREYTERFYTPSGRRYQRLSAKDYRPAKELAGWKHRVRHHWGEVAIVRMDHAEHGDLQVGSDLNVEVEVALGSLQPNDLRIELYHGAIDSRGQLARGQVVVMNLNNQNGDGRATYRGSIPCVTCGPHGYTVRIFPSHPNLGDPVHTGLIHWG